MPAESSLANRLAALGLLVATGFWTWISLFSDTFVGYSLAVFATVVLVSHLGLGVALGLVLRRRWYFAVVAAWGALLVDTVPLLHWLRSGRFEAGYRLPYALARTSAGLCSFWRVRDGGQ